MRPIRRPRLLSRAPSRHAERDGGDREERADRHEEEDRARMPMIEQLPENQRRHDAADMKPVVTKPNTLPNEPGGVTARTIMSRDGMVRPMAKPLSDTISDQQQRARIDKADRAR